MSADVSEMSEMTGCVVEVKTYLADNHHKHSAGCTRADVDLRQEMARSDSTGWWIRSIEGPCSPRWLSEPRTEAHRAYAVDGALGGGLARPLGRDPCTQGLFEYA